MSLMWQSMYCVQLVKKFGNKLILHGHFQPQMCGLSSDYGKVIYLSTVQQKSSASHFLSPKIGNDVSMHNVIIPVIRNLLVFVRPYVTFLPSINYSYVCQTGIK